MTYRVWDIRESFCRLHDTLPTRLAATERAEFFADRYPWGVWHVAGQPGLLLPAPEPPPLLAPIVRVCGRVRRVVQPAFCFSPAE